MTVARRAMPRVVSSTDRVRDARGVEVVTAHGDAALALFEAVEGFASHRAGVATSNARALSLDAGLVGAHVLVGFATCFLGRRDQHARARAAHVEAARSLAERDSTVRERMLTLALGAWCDGDPMRAAALLETVLDESPLDLFALKAHHALCFYLGETSAMRGAVERALPTWQRHAPPALGAVLGCHAFALTETGELARAAAVATESARASAARAEPDPWGKHAAVHALHALGRTEEALERVTGIESDLEGASNFAGHIRWHEAMLRIERGELEQALALHDEVIAVYPARDYRDVVNVTTLLYRLERAGLDVGERWEAVADVGEAMLGDHGSPFADVHYVLALWGAGRSAAVDRYLAAMNAVANAEHDHAAQLARELGIDVARGIAALREEPQRTVEILERLGTLLPRLGGSVAQRQIFRWLHDEGVRRVTRGVAST